jgi:hypothetical protein
MEQVGVGVGGRVAIGVVIVKVTVVFGADAKTRGGLRAGFTPGLSHSVQRSDHSRKSIQQTGINYRK